MGGWSERVMGQKGFFDVERRLEAISAKGDPLETIKRMVRMIRGHRQPDKICGRDSGHAANVLAGPSLTRRSCLLASNRYGAKFAVTKHILRRLCMASLSHSLLVALQSDRAST
jgi:hypothetical protein